MPDHLLGDAAGATPLEPDERGGSIPTYIATRDDLNVAEQQNITQAVLGLRRRRLSVAGVLTDTFVRSFHKEMFGRVWAWAGTYRTTEKSIGIDPVQIAVEVRNLVENAAFWVAPGTGWITRDQAVTKIHHRLVAIHPFPNGNGRHARAYCDVLMRQLGGVPFTWGAGADLQIDNPDRSAYLVALRHADADPDDLEPLVAFARS